MEEPRCSDGCNRKIRSKKCISKADYASSRTFLSSTWNVNGAVAEVLEVKGTRATRIRVTVGEDEGTDDQREATTGQ